MTPRDLSHEHAKLLRSAISGGMSRRQLMVRGMALGLSATAMAGVLTAWQPASAAAQDSPLKGKSVDMTILGIAGWPPARSAWTWRTNCSSPSPRRPTATT